MNFIEQVNYFKTLKKNKDRYIQAQKIIQEFLMPNSIQELNISNSIRNSIIYQHSTGEIPTVFFDEVAQQILLTLQVDCFPRFLASDIFEQFVNNSLASSKRSSQKNDVVNWTIQRVAEWLNSIEMSCYNKTFIDNCISGAELIDLTEEDLKILKIDKLGHRKRLLREITKLKKNRKKAIILNDVPFKVRDEKTNETQAFLMSSSNFTIQELKNRVKEEFGKNWKTIELKCFDSDGDLIHIRNMNDFMYIMEHSPEGSNFIRMIVNGK